MLRGLLLTIFTIAFLTACSGHDTRHGLHPDTYKVKKGDTLYSIAWRYKLDYRALARWNAIKPPYTIYPGQRLRMRPGADSRQAKAQTKTPPRTTQGGKTQAKTQSAATKTTPAPRTGATSPASTKPLRWTWPTQGQVVRHFSNTNTGKKGIDIAGKPGQAVKATAAGQVVYSGSGLIGYGKLIIINHDKNYLSAYAHNRRLLVKEGERVDAGQKIAELGSTGTTDRPLLHFEIRLNGQPVDPLKYLPQR